jgi:DNA-binding transcriptional regulator YiaG
MKMPKRCGNCGSKHLVELGAKDQLTLPWRDYPSVVLTKSLEGFRCADCGEFILNTRQAKEMDTKVIDAIIEQVQTFIAAITQREGCEQKQIATHLGVSPEYLSEIKSGRKIPKFQTFNFLKTLALDANTYKVSSPTYQSDKRATG